jgi:hypothetical protein
MEWPLSSPADPHIEINTMNAKSTGTAPGRMPSRLAAATAEHLVDAWQRSTLTWDLLRQRGNPYREHQKSGKPPVLVFDYEMVPDMEERRRGCPGGRTVVSARGTPPPYQEERFRRVAQVLGLDKPARVRKLA